MKIAIFDLDETLGYFTQLHSIWYCLNIFFDNKLGQHDFNELCELFTKYFRPKIFECLLKLYNNNININIFTNNYGTKNWVIMIKKYIEFRLNKQIFSNIVGCYKYEGQIIEKCRTSHNKILTDFLNCTKLSINNKFIFFDDIQHPQMYHSNLKYIRVKPYRYFYSFNKIFALLKTSNFIKLKLFIYKKQEKDFKKFMFSCIKTLHGFNSTTIITQNYSLFYEINNFIKLDVYNIKRQTRKKVLKYKKKNKRQTKKR